MGGADTHGGDDLMATQQGQAVQLCSEQRQSRKGQSAGPVASKELQNGLHGSVWNDTAPGGDQES